jgi:dTDP-4-amino-4,6-dideoxygalactose transaminase
VITSHSRPWVSEEEIAAVAAALRAGQLATGEQVRRFEAEVARAAGQREGVATSSGTAALHLALLALGVGRGDEVLLPSYVCTAVLNAVHHAGARPVLCDVEEETGNLDAADARRRLSGRAKAVIVVHLFGHPADLEGAQGLGLPVIEDCAQALGAGWRGRPVGSVGRISVFSFYATKVISTGEGGMACSSSRELVERMRALRDYDERDDYEVRYNYKMSDLQASLGLAQLGRLPANLARRAALAGRYDAALGDLGVRLPARRKGCGPIFYRYVVQTDRLEEALCGFAARGVEAKRPVFRPLHHYLDGAAPRLPVTDKVYARALSLPIYPGLSDEEAGRLLEAAGEVLGKGRMRARNMAGKVWQEQAPAQRRAAAAGAAALQGGEGA